jgi:uncharacterized protein (DUF885 family)
VTDEALKSDTPRLVDALSDNFVAEYAALDPVAATAIGVLGHEDKLTDLSPDGHAAREELVRQTYDRIKAADPADQRGQAAKDAFLERAGLYLERYGAHLPQHRMSVIDSGLHEVRGCFDLMDTSTEEGWTNVDRRLAAVPETLAGYKQTLLAEADQGHVSASRQMSEIAIQVRSWTGQTGSNPSVFTTLVKEAPEGSLREQLQRHADGATGAFSEFATFLDEELAPRGAPKEAVGRDLYSLESRYFLGATVDLEETYAWGWEELKRIEDEMHRVSDKIVPAGSIDDAVAALDADPMRNLHSKEAFRDWMQQLADETIHDMADRHFDIPQPVRRIECKIAPTTDGGVRARTSPVPAGCGGRFLRRPRHSPPGVRSRRSTTRAFRGITSRWPRPSSGASSSTASFARCAGCLAAARAGRCTPSG